jgi:hypothetical protein
VLLQPTADQGGNCGRLSCRPNFGTYSARATVHRVERLAARCSHAFEDRDAAIEGAQMRSGHALLPRSCVEREHANGGDCHHECNHLARCRPLRPEAVAASARARLLRRWGAVLGLWMPGRGWRCPASLLLSVFRVPTANRFQDPFKDVPDGQGAGASSGTR